MYDTHLIHFCFFNNLAIDYKLLTSERLQVVEAVIPAVFANEVNQVVNLLVSMPQYFKEKINIEEVCAQLAEKVFFNGVRLLEIVCGIISC